jgi:hypothetical protein
VTSHGDAMSAAMIARSSQAIRDLGGVALAAASVLLTHADCSRKAAGTAARINAPVRANPAG